MLKNLLRPAVSALVALPIMFSIQGCDDRDVATALGAVAIIGGAVAIGIANPDTGHHHRPPPRCHGGYREVCSHYRDRWGGHHSDCRQVYDSCSSRWSAAAPMGLSARIGATEAALSTQAVSTGVANIASKYDLSFEAAERLTSALNEGRQGNLQAVYDLGLTKSDIQGLGRFDMISESSLSTLATKLDTTSESARNLITKLINDIKTQAADVNSDYWRACTASGNWKTPQNLSCKATWWAGCSPANGATLCAAK